ncbi:MAG TPA: 4-hydroxy-tetrahydrodipicolinate synthase [Terriglobales bacterium]|nr:4-hydroxy-tetrahydrodipicolinate synthase [Terriglobales bacterium]
MNNPFRGCGTALITPFAADQPVDEAAFRRLVRFQIEQGIDFLVPCGTTGETPTLSPAEHRRVVAIAVEEAARGPRKVPVLAGAGGNHTAHVIEVAKACAEAGADGVLSVAPYYNKPTQEGLFQHFSAIAASVKLPVVLYNVPGRTSSNIEAATVLRLATAHANIVAVKEASGNLAQMAHIIAGARDGFDVLSGDDSLTLAILALGGRGLVSVASNAAPKVMAQLVAAGVKGDFAAARRLHYQWLPFMEAIFMESSPAPIKYVLSRMGMCQQAYRLPMVPVQPASREKLDAVMRACGLLS